MKFTVVLITLLSVSSTWAIKTKTEEPKDKRETLTGYPGAGHSSHYQTPSYGHEDASAISIGAGYSVGGAKPSYNFGGQGSGATYQISQESLPSSGHALQLAPITVQPSHGGLVSNDLSQLMHQISNGINSGAITLQQASGQNAAYQLSGLGGPGGQELALPQYTYGAPKLQQQFALFDQAQGTVPSYASSSKGLSSYSSTGPVLFTPSESHSNQPSLSYGIPSSGQSLGDFGSASLGAGHSLSGLSLGGSGHAFGGSYPLGGSYAAPSKTSFKPSAFLGASLQSDSGHGLSSLSGSYGAPSFGNTHSSGLGGFSLSSGSHGASFGGSLGNFAGGSSSFAAPTYLPPKSEGFGSLESISAFSSKGHLASPPSTTYGVPTGSYSAASNIHASSTSPQYYVTSAKHSPSASLSSGSSYRGPSSGYSSLSSYSSGPKYSFSGPLSSRFGHPKDSHGAYSETSYNTIKYSEELKPHNH